MKLKSVSDIPFKNINYKSSVIIDDKSRLNLSKKVLSEAGLSVHDEVVITVITSDDDQTFVLINKK